MKYCDAKDPKRMLIACVTIRNFIKVWRGYFMIKKLFVGLVVTSFFGTIFGLDYRTQPDEMMRSNKCAMFRLPTIDTITAQDLKALIESSSNYNDVDNCDFVVVNVLGPNLFADCHITGSVHAPLDQLCKIAPTWEEKGWNKNKTIIVYCALDECDASAKAYYMLRGMGFEKVRAYEGGIREWYQLGFSCEGPCSFDYLRNVEWESMCNISEDTLYVLMLDTLLGRKN